MTMPKPVAIDLTDDELVLMVQSLNEYFGSAKRADSVLAPIIGLPRTEDFDSFVERIIEALESKEPLIDLDWARALFLTEIAWASDLIGSGLDFATNIRDEKALPLLRSVQRKISNYNRFALLRDNFLRPPPDTPPPAAV
ncbi:hypothetical protein [Mycobacterium sp. SMC-14]|uniref:hypothetical protein n=1 Tax=Mycobacterium sp. SMC-14 TaxID=3385968 RepID=UPI00390C6A29